MGEIFVPAVIADLRTIDPGEIRVVTLALPQEYKADGRTYPIQDHLRPGNAFLARPIGARTGKTRRRMYTRSNCAITAARTFETIINHTHETKADTSIWWQTDQVEALHRSGGAIDIRVDPSPDGTALILYENGLRVAPSNLRLEPDDQWPTMQIVAIALSTGITPFLAYARYMKTFGFGRTSQAPGCHFTLIVSVRNPRQLMEHEELLALARSFPENFRYHPVLTREWPSGWPYGKGRIIRVEETGGQEGRVDLGPLRELVPDLSQGHLRLCGNVRVRDQLQRGLREEGWPVLTFRSEVW